LYLYPSCSHPTSRHKSNDDPQDPNIPSNQTPVNVLRWERNNIRLWMRRLPFPVFGTSCLFRPFLPVWTDAPTTHVGHGPLSRLWKAHFNHGRLSPLARRRYLLSLLLSPRVLRSTLRLSLTSTLGQTICARLGDVESCIWPSPRTIK
jgi:hypothetical protein